MITASDLRIGNIVRAGITPNIEPEKRGLIYILGSALDIVYIEKTPDIADPIPLTEKWMEQFGMVTLDNEIDVIVWGFKDRPEVCYVSDGFDKPLPIYFEYDGEFTTVRKEIKYVHELQNLHHALTGQELQLIK